MRAISTRSRNDISFLGPQMIKALPFHFFQEASSHAEFEEFQLRSIERPGHAGFVATTEVSPARSLETRRGPAPRKPGLTWRVAQILTIAIGLLVLGGCGGGWQGARSLQPEITAQPASQTVSVGQAATFTVSATSSAPVSYQWNKGGAPISGATSSSYTTPPTTTADNGSTFTATVSPPQGL
jgi:hypothetical protein